MGKYFGERAEQLFNFFIPRARSVEGGSDDNLWLTTHTKQQDLPTG